ncbi:hypothetical protein RRG08_058790 [Elysia crispata]|uniref:Uncharacterized protein n=1 Tax=Elysia crispata TaxID=231223 RepID=A0AAE1D6G2_9GAST|nr:hypothetical protein RRG08_058790 [Elysia crispata]
MNHCMNPLVTESREILLWFRPLTQVMRTQEKGYDLMQEPVDKSCSEPSSALVLARLSYCGQPISVLQHPRWFLLDSASVDSPSRYSSIRAGSC